MKPSTRKKMWIFLAVLLTPVVLLALAVGVIWLLPAPPSDESDDISVLHARTTETPAASGTPPGAALPAVPAPAPTPVPAVTVTPPAPAPTPAPVAVAVQPVPTAPIAPPVSLPAPPAPSVPLVPAAPEAPPTVAIIPAPPILHASAAPPTATLPTIAVPSIPVPAAPPAAIVPPPPPPVNWHPFIKPGEKLSYRIGWGFVTAGYGTLEVMPAGTHNGVPAWQIVMTAKTTPFVDKVYKVRDRMESWVAPDMSHALAYSQDQKEGKTINDLDVVFDWDKTEARRTRNDEAKKPVKIAPGTFDPLSALFAFRMQSFKKGDTIVIPVSDGKFFVKGTAVVLDEEKIETPAGEFETYKIEPDIKDLAGVFKKSKGAKITVWVTKDARHIPVKVSSKVMVGSFYAELTGIEPAPAPAPAAPK